MWRGLAKFNTIQRSLFWPPLLDYITENHTSSPQTSNTSIHMSILNQFQINQMHMRKLRMAKGWSAYGSSKKEYCDFSFKCLPLLCQSPLKLGAVVIVWHVALHISNCCCPFSKEFKKAHWVTNGESSLILSVVSKGRGGHGRRGRLLCKLGCLRDTHKY